VKASDLDRVRGLLNRLDTLQKELQRFENLPPDLERITIFFSFEDREERTNREIDFDLTTPEEAPVRQIMKEILDARVQVIVDQVKELGVELDV